jgi:putative ABC transport system permease protein
MLTQELSAATLDDYSKYYDEITEFSNATYEEVIEKIGFVAIDSPNKINLFASTFENKDVITAAIDSYNASVSQEKQIAYTDILGIMMSSITTIINAITYVLIAFVAISLVVSSIMIGGITLISVQERTKEIGVLRAIGASKKDVSSMFNAETIIIGFCAGLLGVLVTYALCIPINLILNALTDIPNLKAVLPIGAAIILVLISVTLTLISGLIPAKSAAKKDPVVALRTE